MSSQGSAASSASSRRTPSTERPSSPPPTATPATPRSRAKDKTEDREVVVDNPFPFLAPLFDFKGGSHDKKGNTNLFFRCVSCGPSQRRPLSCSLRSKSNLKTHVQRCHPKSMAQYTALIEGKRRRQPEKYQPSVADIFSGTRPASQAECERLITEFIINSGQPFSVVSQPSFVKLVQRLHPGRRVQL